LTALVRGLSFVAMFRRKIFRVRLPRGGPLILGKRTLVMGVLNVTPDSFSDGGRFFSTKRAIAHALQMQHDGADILDIGGESTRPGSEGISAEEELRRVLPVLRALRGRLRIPISIDTQKAVVAEAAVAAGAKILNDVSALRSDPALADIVRRHRLPIILMRMRGVPRTMQKRPFARNVVQDVTQGLREAVQRARRAGIPRSQIILDPGIGFGKSFGQNFELLARLPELAKLGSPLLVGTSRKTFIGVALGSTEKPVPPGERLWGTAATVAAAIFGGAHIVRVHDVKEMRDVVQMCDRTLAAM
jgi:dihydropteroate synthase